MDRSTITSLVLLLVALASALAVFGVLRERGNRAVVAGCASIATGVAVVALYVGFEIVRIVV